MLLLSVHTAIHVLFTRTNSIGTSHRRCRGRAVVGACKFCIRCRYYTQKIAHLTQFVNVFVAVSEILRCLLHVYNFQLYERVLFTLSFSLSHSFSICLFIFWIFYQLIRSAKFVSNDFARNISAACILLKAFVVLSFEINLTAYCTYFQIVNEQQRCKNVRKLTHFNRRGKFLSLESHPFFTGFIYRYQSVQLNFSIYQIDWKPRGFNFDICWFV